MAFAFTLPAAVASLKDVWCDFAFDFLQEAILIKGFFLVFCRCLFTWRAHLLCQAVPVLSPWAGHLFRRD